MRRAFLTSTTALSAALCLALAGRAIAQSAPADIGSVSSTASQLSDDQGPYAPPPPGSAAAVAPSAAPIEAAQPTSVVGSSFIRNSTIPAQNYDELVKFTPSLFNLQPAGPVSQQNYAESIRGFQYNQFNTTFDGLVLPGTVSNFAPQSATYFTSHDLGSLSLDRGPGTASTIGYATFGGTLSLFSKEPADRFGGEVYSTFGSFDQKLWGVELDSGAQPQLNGGRGFIDFSRLQTGAYLTGVTTDRDNVFGKWEQPIGSNTLVTFVGMYNDSYGHTSYGTSLAQIAKYGPDYALNLNPKSQDFFGYNTDRYDTDFEYIKIKSELGDGWTFEETPYTDSYFRSGTEGADPNGGTPNLGLTGGGKEYINNIRVHPVDDVPGTTKHNDFRDWGSVTRFTKDTPWGQLRFGAWADYISNSVYRARVDFTRSSGIQGFDLINYTTKLGAPDLSQRYRDRLVTGQPYLEFAWTPLKGLTITPGVRYTSITRELDVGILSNTPTGTQNKTWNKLQPSVDAHYLITKDWAVYAQIAKGFLAPPLSTLQTAVQATAQPQETVNYQIGSTYRHGNLALGGDLYYIPFQNFIASRTTPEGTLYFNAGGALYRGIEAEGTYGLGRGLFLTGNGSLNDARFDNGVHIYQAPQNTAAGGIIFDHNSMVLDRDKVYASLLVKEVGKQYGLNGLTKAGAPTVSYPIESFTTLDLALGYTIPVQDHRSVRVALNLYNLTNDHSLIGFAGVSGSGNIPLYWTDPGFSGFVSVSVTL